MAAPLLDLLRRLAAPAAALALAAALVPAAATAAATGPVVDVTTTTTVEPAPEPVDVVAQEPDARWPVRRPTVARGATVARIVTASRARPHLATTRGSILLRTTTQWSHQAQTLLALDSAVRGGTRWVKVLLPDRPNGSTAWVRRDDVILSGSRWWVDVSTGTRTVKVYHRGKRVRQFRAVVGAPGTPTPHTLAAIYERNRQANPRLFVGSWVLSLTALSDVLDNYGGGPGRVALHGRAGASLLDPLGSARSHGCVRMRNADVGYLAARLPVGTPVRLH